jgi:2-polyprenyl-3-methyl-5-hydroxy-6-metoxy-1,4-benzoquinol methylase
MSLTILFAAQHHPAIEERYGSWQNRLLVRRQAKSAAVIEFENDTPASEALRGVTTERVLVVTDPLLVATPRVVELLAAALDADPSASAAVPVTNESSVAEQRVPPPRLYLTLAQLEEAAEEVAKQTAVTTLAWVDGDPGIFLARTAMIRASDSPLRKVLARQRVAIVSGAYVHRFPSHRGGLNEALLDYVAPGTKSVLEFGCGEAALGHAIKQRFGCRVAGIELDRDAAAVASTRIDQVWSGDVRQLVNEVDEQFDLIIGGDVLEHLDEPWTFLGLMKRLSKPGGQLVMSLPNISCWAIVNDLLRGRFDYVYMGILCAGHLRFFTRRTILDMLELSGWELVRIDGREDFGSAEYQDLIAKLTAAGIEFSRDDIGPAGHIVIARNPGA